MRTIVAGIPGTLYEKASHYVASRKAPLEQVVEQAIAQALDAWSTPSPIAQRAARADREKFLAVLAKVPDVEPEEEDRLD